jgi:branched-chain amino acid transport system substrate-binding protein
MIGPVARRLLACLVVALLLTGGVFGMGGGRTEAAAKSCKLATNLVLTGGWAPFGVGMFNSFKLAVDQATAAGELKDIKVDVSRGDNAGDTPQGVALATKAGQDPDVVGAFCCWASGIGVATHSVYNRYGLPLILGGSNDHRSSRPFHQSKVVFRNSPYDLINMKMAAVYAVEVGAFKRLYLLDDTTPFGRTQVDEFEKVARKLGGDKVILGRDSITPNEKDFSPILTKIKPLNIDLLYLGGRVVEAALIRQQMVKLGFTAALMSSGGVFSETYIKTAGPASEGSLATFWGLPIEYYPEGRGVKFDRDYKAAGFKEPYESFGPMAYAAGQVYAQAIKRVGCDRQKILKDLETQEFDTILGKFRFDENGMLDILNIAVYRVEQGQWKILYKTDRKATKFEKVS